MAGMATELNLQANDPGTFSGLSAQFSGDGFSNMRFELTAMAPKAYADWIEASHAQGGPLDLRAYAELARPSQNEPPRAFGSTSAGLFEAILATPGAAPREAAP